MSAIRRDKLDAITSDLVRIRAEWRSELSGQEGALECCHIYGRRRKSTRYHPWNLVALTHAEHRYFTENPLAFSHWCNGKFGVDRMHELTRLANTTVKMTPRQLEGLYRHYLAEFERLRQARANARTGRIEFTYPDPLPEAEPRKRAKRKKPTKYIRKVSGEVVKRDAA